MAGKIGTLSKNTYHVGSISKGGGRLFRELSDRSKTSLQTSLTMKHRGK
jgi:hypothetical protein